MRDALVRLGTPCEGPWTDPLAVWVLLVSYMALEATRVSKKVGRLRLRRGRTDTLRWDSKPQRSLLLVIRRSQPLTAVLSHQTQPMKNN